MKKTYSPDFIIHLLEEPTDDRRILKHQLKREAYLRDLVQALKISRKPLTRRILCDIIGYRHRFAKSAVPILLECLEDPNWEVRTDATDALCRIGDPRVGQTLLEHFKTDPLPAYAFGLGSIKYKEAIPDLIRALLNDSATIRGASAWSLGVMHAMEAKNSIKEALQNENDEWAINKMKTAIENLEEI